MIDHISIAVRDLSASAKFYDAVLGALGLARLVERPTTVGFGKQYPEFWLNLRPAIAPREAGCGAHICLRAREPGEVDAFHAAALAAGGRDNGAPGLRPHYHADYYGAFVFDPDGNNVEAVCHRPE
jgi:catechol 2,3-dioxygenase-like lactoylglutathione lyase family enzyme